MIANALKPAPATLVAQIPSTLEPHLFHLRFTGRNRLRQRTRPSLQKFQMTRQFVQHPNTHIIPGLAHNPREQGVVYQMVECGAAREQILDGHLHPARTKPANILNQFVGAGNVMLVIQKKLLLVHGAWFAPST
jgi:hypothetical protein